MNDFGIQEISATLVVGGVLIFLASISCLVARKCSLREATIPVAGFFETLKFNEASKLLLAFAFAFVAGSAIEGLSRPTLDSGSYPIPFWESTEAIRSDVFFDEDRPFLETLKYSRQVRNAMYLSDGRLPLYRPDEEEVFQFEPPERAERIFVEFSNSNVKEYAKVLLTNLRDASVDLGDSNMSLAKRVRSGVAQAYYTCKNVLYKNGEYRGELRALEVRCNIARSLSFSFLTVFLIASVLVIGRLTTDLWSMLIGVGSGVTMFVAAATWGIVLWALVLRIPTSEPGDAEILRNSNIFGTVATGSGITALLPAALIAGLCFWHPGRSYLTIRRKCVFGAAQSWWPYARLLAMLSIAFAFFGLATSVHRVEQEAFLRRIFGYMTTEIQETSPLLQAPSNDHSGSKSQVAKLPATS